MTPCAAGIAHCVCPQRPALGQHHLRPEGARCGEPAAAHRRCTQAAVGTRITFVDFEYGAYNYRAFDFANHFCECCGFECDWDQFPQRASQEIFFRGYLAQELGVADADVSAGEVDRLFEEAGPWAVMPNLFWCLWACVQARHSPIEFDFLGYAKLRLGGFKRLEAQCKAFLR
jgi:thiamine kinase-like enzyme